VQKKKTALNVTKQAAFNTLSSYFKGIKGKEKTVTDLNSLDIPYFLDHKTHQDFTRKTWGNNILFADETQIHKYLLNKTAV